MPEGIRALLFDLDGVITSTALIHAAAWKEMFDAYLKSHSPAQPPFDSNVDYATYVDGRPRFDGVRNFLNARQIVLPAGTPDDPPDAQTICGLGNRKNEIVQRLIAEGGVEAYPGTIKYLDAAQAAGMRMGVVSSSANCRAVLESAGLIDRFEEIMDGVVAAQRNINGKPAPDTYTAAAADLGVSVDKAAVFEDALAGVEAGRAGGFGYVVGVDRVGQTAALKEHGADVVVRDLEDLIAK